MFLEDSKGMIILSTPLLALRTNALILFAELAKDPQALIGRWYHLRTTDGALSNLGQLRFKCVPFEENGYADSACSCCTSRSHVIATDD